MSDDTRDYNTTYVEGNGSLGGRRGGTSARSAGASSDIVVLVIQA